MAKKKTQKVRPFPLFSYWKDGSTQVAVNPDPPTPTEARPFHVAISNEVYIPVSILVFARNESHALSRVCLALAECRDKQYAGGVLSDELRGRAQFLLDAIQNGTMTLEIRPLDVGLICATVNWAGNGGLL